MGAPSEDVEHCTQQGAQQLQDGHLSQAMQAFTNAYNKSLESSDQSIQRACAFNLGAVYIAMQEVDKGLEMLQKAVPVSKSTDKSPNADLFFNFGLAYELKGNQKEAVKYFELALEEYVSQGNSVMEAETASRIGSLYMTLNNYLQATRAYGISAVAYKKVKQIERATLCMCYQASALLKAKKQDETLDTADSCMVLCQQFSRLQGNVYNELGLLYTQCQDYGKAATCFELALPMCRGSHVDGRRKAVVIQNLGAVYNSLGDYQRAIRFHKSASQIHAKLGNRRKQGECFANLAFALSQLGDTEGAEESYLHALQAGRDTDDHHAQWQALEGLGAVAFTQQKIPRAVRLYKQALSTLAASGEKNSSAQERIVGKLSSALQWQLGKTEHQQQGQNYGDEVNILVNDLPRPPSRQEMRLINEIKMLREYQNSSKIASNFDTIALGIGDYDTDSDLSVRHLRRRDKIRSRRNKVGRDTVDLEDEQLKQLAREEKQKQRPKISGRLGSRRKLNNGSSVNSLSQARRGRKTLLRCEDHDSEEEWKHNMQSMMRRDSSEGYHERLRPPSSGDESLSRRQSELLNSIPITQSVGSASDDERATGQESPPASEALDNTGEGVRGYQRALQQLNEGDTATDTLVSSSEEDVTGSSVTVTDTNEPTDTLPTSPPPPPPNTPPQRPLGATYEKPVDVNIEPEDATLDQPNLQRGYSAKNYFKEAIPMDTNSGTIRISVPKQDDPDYMTIKTIKPGPSHYEPQPSTSSARPDSPERMPPPPPPRNDDLKLSEMSHAEQEAFLSEYHQKWSENTRDKVGRSGDEDLLENGKPKSRKRKSQMSMACSIM